jgi:hypothetical protein
LRLVALTTLVLCALASCGPRNEQLQGNGLGSFGGGKIVVERLSIKGSDLAMRFGVKTGGVKDYKIFVHGFPASKELLPAGSEFFGWDHFPQVPFSQMTPGQAYEDVYTIPVKDPKGIRIQVGFFDEADPAYTPVAKDGSKVSFLELRSPP